VGTDISPLNIAQVWNVPDIKRRLKFLIFALLIFVIGTHIPTPGISTNLIASFFGQAGAGGGGLFGLLDLFTGGALRKFSVLALGVMPYINASILMQILVAIEPRLKEIQREGEEGRKLISKYTRYLAIFFGFLQGFGLIFSIQGGALSPDYTGVMSFIAPLTALLVVVAGTCFLMWLGDEITQKGIGNGISLIIFIGIVASVPWMVATEIMQAQFDQTRWSAILLFFVFLVIIVAGIVWIQLSVRKIPIQYARRQVGRKIYGGQSTFLPVKVAMAGVIPIIFAVSLLMIPPTILSFMQEWTKGNQLWGRFENSIWYLIFEWSLVFMFTFIYTAITFNTKEISDNLKKHGGFIPGIRPGKPTFDFLDKVLHRVTFFGGVFLATVAVLPIVASDRRQLAGIRGYAGADPDVLHRRDQPADCCGRGSRYRAAAPCSHGDAALFGVHQVMEIVIFLGPPASGKGTQAARFSEAHGFLHFDMGKALREEAASSSPLAEEIRSFTDTGRLVPNEVVQRLIQLMFAANQERDIILDGFPRSMEQVELLKRAMSDAGRDLTAAVLVSLPEDDIAERILNRRVCPVCGRVYNLVTVPPESDEKCDDDGSPLEHRADDTEDVLNERIAVYNEQTQPIIAHYESEGLLVRVDGVADIDDVSMQIEKVLLGV